MVVRNAFKNNYKLKFYELIRFVKPVNRKRRYTGPLKVKINNRKKEFSWTFYQLCRFKIGYRCFVISQISWIGFVLFV